MAMKMTLDWKRAGDLFFLGQAQRRVITFIQVLLVVLLALALAELTWKLIPAQVSSLAPSARGPAGVPSPRAQGEAGMSWDIARWHLYGVKAEGREIPAVETLPETQLNLILSGVVASGGATTGGGAIIAVPGGVEAFYPVNAQLPGGAVLKEVYPDRVVLERNGRLETLRLPKEGLSEVRGGAGQAAAARPAAPRGGAAGSPATLREYRDMVFTDPQTAVNLVKITPKSAGGRFLGYELQPGRDAALLSRMGLSPGDVVTSVNGVTLDSPAKALSLLRELSTTEEFRVDIQRGGVPQSLMININQ